MYIETMDQAGQVADLLNTRNDLTKEYSAEDVFQTKEQYFVILEQQRIVACGQARKVQWYQWEILHVSVQEGYEGRGYGSRIVRNLEVRIREGGGRIAQCTIRLGNGRSEHLFLNLGYKITVEFYNSPTRHRVRVYQKI